MEKHILNNSIRISIYAVLLMACIYPGSITAQSSKEIPPEGGFMGGPPPGGTGRGPGPMIGAAELKHSDISKYFTDLNASTASINAYVDYLFEKKLLTDPSGDKLFHPEEKLTRGDFAVMLNSKYKYRKANGSYDDISQKDYYYDAVTKGKASRVFDDTKRFLPERFVTREQLALWIFRSEINNGMPEFMVSSDVSAFKDGHQFSDELKKAVGTLAKIQIIKPDDNGNFNPSAEITRFEVVKPLYRISFLGGKPGSGTGGPGGPGMMPGGGPGTVDHGSTAATVIKDVSGKTFVSKADDENALRAEGKVNVTLKNVVIKKDAGEAKGGDACNFYGSNAAFLVMEGAEVSIDNSIVETSVNGGNGIFSYGKGTEVTVTNCSIRTNKGNSGGIMVTGGGAMNINDSHIETMGRSSAALRSDRGGGILVVKGGTYTAHGEGSPSIYCTADITVSDASLTATTSEAVVIEGKNSVALKNCIVSGNMIKHNVQNLQNIMIYQSMSGDAEEGRSSFSMEGGSLTSQNGDMVYITNTSCKVKFKEVALTLSNDVFLKVVGNDARNGWGVAGRNGGKCIFTAENQQINGNIIVDKISSLSISLTVGSKLTGSINTGIEGGNVSLHIDKTSKWILTGDSSVNSFKGEVKNIDQNGYKLYVGGKLFAH